MKKYLLLIFVSILFSNQLFGDEALSAQKLKMSFYVLQENFSLDNRNRNQFQRNTQLIPLAEKSVENALKFYPKDIEFTLDVIRTLYVEGNYYLRKEKFALSQKKLTLAKALCEKYIDHQEGDALQISKKLAEAHPTLPALYSLVLHHLGQQPLYHKDSPIKMPAALSYLKQALAIREVIDFHPKAFWDVPDNNKIVGDAVFFKRVLGRAYIEMGHLNEAEEICLSLLACKDPYNQLITLRDLVKIYHLKTFESQGDQKQKHYKKAMDYAKECLHVLETSQDLGEHTRITSTYVVIAKLYADEQNPFQNLEESQNILEEGKAQCHEDLKVTLGDLSEELGLVLSKLSQKELQEAIKIRWGYTEIENVDSLKYLDDPLAHLSNYEKLGDLFLEQNHFFSASAFYGNGLSLALKDSNEPLRVSRFYQKLRLTECRLLGLQDEPFFGIIYEDLLKSYKRDLILLRDRIKVMVKENIEIETIYSHTLENYKALLRLIFQDLFETLGPPPSQEFAFLAFGSLGRGCATPYSDIEWAILIKDEAHRHYFKVLSELFSIRIHALGESPIAGFNIDSMNWLSRDDGPSIKGIRLDPVSGNGIIPHISLEGKFELTATPQKLAEIFNSKTDSPMHIKATFFTYTTILGNEELVKEYQKEIDRLLDQPDGMRRAFTEQMISKDLEAFYLRLGCWLDQKNSYSIKYDFYRPFTLILDALAMQQNLHAKSPWKLIEIFKQKGLIDEELRDVLRKDFDEVARIQLNTYLSYDRQYPLIFSNKLESEKDANLYYHDEQSLFSLLQTIIKFQNKVGSFCE